MVATLERPQRPIRVLFLCTGNSARSQMAEAFLRHYGGARFAPQSAGTAPAPEINPLTIRVMGEIDIALDGQYPKSIESVLRLGHDWDYAITTCDQARDACPTLPGDSEQIHWGFEDPAKAEGTLDERLRVFSRVRDEIKRRVQLFLELPVHGQRAGGRA